MYKFFFLTLVFTIFLSCSKQIYDVSQNKIQPFIDGDQMEWPASSY